MRPYILKFFCMSFFMLILLFFAGTSCKSTKEGCGQEEAYNNPDMETSKRGKSSLFTKSQSKKLKIKSR
jgi:hypothetical protein